MSHEYCEFGPRVSIRAFECTAGQELLICRAWRTGPGVGYRQWIGTASARGSSCQASPTILRCSDQSSGRWVMRDRHAAVS
jgi:hypothetical protein